MSNTDKTPAQKAVEILTRCGHWSHVGAASFVEKDLTKEEVEQLAQMYDDLAAADAIASQGRGAVIPKRPALTPQQKVQLAKAAGVGDRYRQWVDAVADRRNPPAGEAPQPDQVEVTGEQLSMTTTVSLADGTLEAAVSPETQAAPSVIGTGEP